MCAPLTLIPNPPLRPLRAPIARERVRCCAGINPHIGDALEMIQLQSSSSCADVRVRVRVISVIDLTSLILTRVRLCVSVSMRVRAVLQGLWVRLVITATRPHSHVLLRVGGAPHIIEHTRLAITLSGFGFIFPSRWRSNTPSGRAQSVNPARTCPT